jgi:beta-lactamase class A
MSRLLLLLTACLTYAALSAQPNADLQRTVTALLAARKATVGIAVSGPDGREVLSVHADRRFPMQSVFKFHIALAVLDYADRGKLRLSDTIRIGPADLQLKTWSPMKDAHPQGAALTIAEIMRYTVSLSDNIGCDILLRHIGGPRTVQRYLRRRGIRDCAIVATEAEMHSDWSVQFNNWTTPMAAVQTLQLFYARKGLSKQSFDFLWNTMVETSTGKNRLKSPLPTDVVLAHKTGTSSTNKAGVTAAVNDIGVVVLPDGRHYCIAVLVTESTEDMAANEKIIADVSQLVWAHFVQKNGPPQPVRVAVDTFRWVDRTRGRVVPVACYGTPSMTKTKTPVVIFSHGYGQNKGGDYLAYSYLTENLAANGYFVASIQHELPTDSLLPLTGIPQVVRRPFWERGADNIRFVIETLKKSRDDLDFDRITLIGHSNGGDMTALFPQKYPGIVSAIITLDHRRMPLPRTGDLRVYSLRSSDQTADANVLPPPEVQQQLRITLVQLPDTPHNNMDDSADARQREEINAHILSFLKQK